MNTSSYKPAHLAPSPKYPNGQGGHSAPTSGAGASIHSASWKHDTSVHPLTSTVQNCPSHAVDMYVYDVLMYNNP